MKTKTLGGIMLLLGTSVGAGILAIPIASAHEGFLLSSFLLIICWLIMTLGALCLLEVNMSLPAKNNLISMSEATIGKIGKYCTWFMYLLLLYSLLCAYIAGSANIVFAITQHFHLHTPAWANTIIAVFVLSAIVYKGIYSVDIITRGLMSAKLIAYIIIVIAIAPHLTLHNLSVNPFINSNNLNQLANLSAKTHANNYHININTVMVMITSFGFAIIIPSLRTYFNSDIKQLKIVVLLGSLIPLMLYIIWVGIIQGLIPTHGIHGLYNIANSQNTNAELMSSIYYYINKPWISNIANIFISICAVTSFLGVSLSLTDFIADGYKLNKAKHSHNILIYLITFIPPTIIVLFYPGIFIKALSYAGIFCVLLLIILPILMVIAKRYKTNPISNNNKNQFLVPGGITPLILGLILAIIILAMLAYQ